MKSCDDVIDCVIDTVCVELAVDEPVATGVLVAEEDDVESCDDVIVCAIVTACDELAVDDRVGNCVEVID